MVLIKIATHKTLMIMLVGKKQGNANALYNEKNQRKSKEDILMDNASNFGNKNRDNLGHLEKLKLKFKLLYPDLIIMVD